VNTQTLAATLLALAASAGAVAQTQNQGQTPPHNPQAQEDAPHPEPEMQPGTSVGAPVAPKGSKYGPADRKQRETPPPAANVGGPAPPMKPNRQ